MITRMIIQAPRQPSRIEGRKSGRKCKGKCHLISNYIGLKRVKFGAEMGYKKCKMCDCHFLKVDYLYCKCCNTKLRVKNPRRTVEVKQKAVEFLSEISKNI